MAKQARKNSSAKRGEPGSADDTLVADRMLGKAVNAVRRSVKVDRRHDVPYVGGAAATERRFISTAASRGLSRRKAGGSMPSRFSFCTRRWSGRC